VNFTTRSDTIRCVKLMEDVGMNLLVFVGGDRAARDIYEAVNTKVTCLGVPSGVKIYSSCFACSPEGAVELIRFLKRRS